MNQRGESETHVSVDPPRETELDELRSETQSLRRRLNFWQRAAWLLVGCGVIVGTIIWQRGELRRRECANSLEYHASRAERIQLGSQSPDILEHQWQFMEQGLARAAPMHYDLIVHNWRTTPSGSESLPLAVCRESHFLALSRGRNVLRRVGDRFEIVWMSEEAVGPIVADAAKDNRGN
jgi:hypothetical protein